MKKYQALRQKRATELSHLIKTHKYTKEDRVKVVSFMKTEANYYEERYKVIANLLAKAKAKNKATLVKKLEKELGLAKQNAIDSMSRFELEKKILMDEHK